MIKENKKLWEKFNNHLMNEGITDKRKKKLYTMYVVCDRGLKKDLNKIIRKDIESFIKKLHSNTFLKANGEPYSGSTKSDIKKFLKQFYKWLKGNNEFYPPEVAWLKTKIPKDQKPIQKDIITLSQLNKMANYFMKPEYRYLTLLLFDSGFRIDEMLSVKKSNLTWEHYDDDSSCWWIECTRSKTFPRKIPVPLFTEDINIFVNSSYFQGLKNEEYIFNQSYSAIRKAVARAYISVTKKKKNNFCIHSFRHSSATYYSQKLDGDSILLSQRFGWSLDAKELKTYVRLSGTYQKAQAKKVYANKTHELEKQLKEEQKKREELEKKFDSFKKQLMKDILKKTLDKGAK